MSYDWNSNHGYGHHSACYSHSSNHAHVMSDNMVHIMTHMRHESHDNIENRWVCWQLFDTHKQLFYMSM